MLTPTSWQHPQQIGLCFGGGEGHIWGLNKWAGGRGCRENRMTGQQARPQGRQGSAEPALWPARLLVGGREGPAAKVSRPPLSGLTLIFVGGATGESGGAGRGARGLGRT